MTVRPPEQSARPGASGSSRGRPVRWLRRAVICALVVAVLLVALDRVAEVVTARELAGKIQTSQGLSARPKVKIRGFPFLTQVVRGRYGRVDLTAAAPIVRAGVRVATARVHLYGVKVKASDALHGSVRNVPVDHATGDALINYADLSALINRYTGGLGGTITVGAAGPGRARLSGPLGLSLDVRAAIVGGRVRITPDAAALQALPALVRPVVEQALATPIPLPPFPFGVTLTSAQLGPAGLALHAVSRNSVFPVK